MHASLQSTLIFSGTFEGMQFGVCISEMSCDVTGSGSQVVLHRSSVTQSLKAMCRTISATGPAHSVARPARQCGNESQSWKTLETAAHSALIFIFDKKLLHLTQDRCISAISLLESLEALQVWAASVRGRKATRARHKETSEYSSFLAKFFGLRCCLKKLRLELAHSYESWQNWVFGKAELQWSVNIVNISSSYLHHETVWSLVTPGVSIILL